MFYVIYPELWKLLIKNENFVIVEQGGGGPFDVSGGPFVVLENLEKNLDFGIFFRNFKNNENFELIYPSQRQNLLPTLEIITHNFQNFQKIQNFRKKFQNLEFFSKISKTTKGPPLTSKRPPPPHYPITKFSIFSRVSKARGI